MEDFTLARGLGRGREDSRKKEPSISSAIFLGSVFQEQVQRKIQLYSDNMFDTPVSEISSLICAEQVVLLIEMSCDKKPEERVNLRLILHQEGSTT